MISLIYRAVLQVQRGPSIARPFWRRATRHPAAPCSRSYDDREMNGYQCVNRAPVLSMIRLFLESVSEDNRRTTGPALPCDELSESRD